MRIRDFKSLQVFIFMQKFSVYLLALRYLSDKMKIIQESLIATHQFTLDGNGNRTNVVENEPLVPAQGANTTSYTYNTKENVF